jgi:hypothetical protein
MDGLHSENKTAILEILDEVRRRVEADEVLQMMIVFEDLAGFDVEWSGTEDRMSIAGFAIGAALTRMGFVRAED